MPRHLPPAKTLFQSEANVLRSPYCGIRKRKKKLLSLLIQMSSESLFIMVIYVEDFGENTFEAAWHGMASLSPPSQNGQGRGLVFHSCESV